MARTRIRRLNGTEPLATYVRHVRTLTLGGKNDDVDLYRLADGTEIECISDAGDGRDVPRECEREADHYPGHRPGE